MLITAVEAVIMTAILVAFVTQIGIPLYRGTPLFPVLKPERRLRGELAEMEQARIERGLKRKVDSARARLNKEEPSDGRS